jgi:hypothetical protein
MCEGMFTHTIKSLWQDMPGGGDWHFVWAKAEEQTKKANAAGTISFAIIGRVRNVTRQSLLFQPSGQIMRDIHHFTPEYWRTWLSSVDWKVFAAGKSWLESFLILPPPARPLR